MDLTPGQLAELATAVASALEARRDPDVRSVVSPQAYDLAHIVMGADPEPSQLRDRTPEQVWHILLTCSPKRRFAFLRTAMADSKQVEECFAKQGECAMERTRG